MKQLQTYKNILWDFDGVILDSMQVRDLGFTEVLKGFPEEEVEKLLDYHRRNGGLSRYVKFRYFFEEIRNESITEKKVKQLAVRFSKIMLKHLIDEQYLIQESLEYIQNHYQKQNFHIVSGSDGEELNKICKGLKIDQYFKSIQGSPTPKNDLVANLLEEKQYVLKETCLIGDSVNDAEAANLNKIDFFGYNNPKLKVFFPNYIEGFETK